MSSELEVQLCDFCIEILQLIPKTHGRLGRWYDLLKRTSFDESARTCRLCEVIHRELRKSHGADIQHLFSRPVPWPTSLFVNSSARRGELGLVCQFTLRFEKPVEGFSKSCDVRFGVSAEKGSPASASIVTRLPVFDDRSERAFELVQSWLNECDIDHGDCHMDNQPTSGLSRLPTRVLEILGSVERPTVRLIETQGKEARYCALSHCWGTVQPLTTTRANLERHLSNIPSNQLPTTFRDAVVLAKGIDIPYLWIDSLCIIQDDIKDWEQEARAMEALYKNATLVIAAAGSENSAKGLFITARPETLPIEVPFMTDGVSKGSFLVAIASSARNSPGLDCPLSERAWAFQEWYLARRLVFFMPGGLTWRCKELSVNERGADTDLQFYSRDQSWFRILWEYSQRQLTYKSDRLIALQGVVNNIQRSRQCRFRYGIWEDQIIEQLIWRVVGRYEQGELDLPSWSWAASECSKAWFLELKEDVRHHHQAISISESGTLRTSGILMRPAFSRDNILPCCDRNLCSLEERSYSSEAEMLSLYHGITDSSTNLVISSLGEILGLAVFDQGLIPNAVCFLASSCQRDSKDVLFGDNSSNALYPDDEVDMDAIDSRDAEELVASRGDSQSDANQNYDGRPTEGEAQEEDEDDEEEAQSSKIEEDLEMTGVDYDSEAEESDSSHEDAHQCLDFSKFAISRRVHFALLLEPVCEAKYKRVGVAMLYPRAWDLKDEVAEFEIV